ncbi:hypothetical protein BD410DRAFT_94108 [Rickenella mellea]|uniref:Uncharacterized protein n=1 Tax=Rickenella mellea TaxID=50990 RepID=A0A4Y7QAE3_9AGAM|nr:hypothetical protein BD410DRAFT_94108 [Rickenella mellea]
MSFATKPSWPPNLPPPPMPPGYSYGARAWQSGSWRPGPPSQASSAADPRFRGPWAAAAASAQQQQQAYNWGKKPPPKPGSAEYYSFKLVDNPLGLSNMHIRATTPPPGGSQRENADQPSQNGRPRRENDENNAPAMVWVPALADDTVPERGRTFGSSRRTRSSSQPSSSGRSSHPDQYSPPLRTSADYWTGQRPVDGDDSHRARRRSTRSPTSQHTRLMRSQSDLRRHSEDSYGISARSRDADDLRDGPYAPQRRASRDSQQSSQSHAYSRRPSHDVYDSSYTPTSRASDDTDRTHPHSRANTFPRATPSRQGSEPNGSSSTSSRAVQRAHTMPADIVRLQHPMSAPLSREDSPAFTEHRELRPTFSPNIVRTPVHYSSPPRSPEDIDNAIRRSQPAPPSRRSSLDNHDFGGVPIRASSMPAQLQQQSGPPSGLLSQISEEPDSMLSPIFLDRSLPEGSGSGSSIFHGRRGPTPHPLALRRSDTMPNEDDDEDEVGGDDRYDSTPRRPYETIGPYPLYASREAAVTPKNRSQPPSRQGSMEPYAAPLPPSRQGSMEPYGPSLPPSRQGSMEPYGPPLPPSRQGSMEPYPPPSPPSPDSPAPPPAHPHYVYNHGNSQSTPHLHQRSATQTPVDSRPYSSRSRPPSPSRSSPYRDDFPSSLAESASFHRQQAGLGLGPAWPSADIPTRSYPYTSDEISPSLSRKPTTAASASAPYDSSTRSYSYRDESPSSSQPAPFSSSSRPNIHTPPQEIRIRSSSSGHDAPTLPHSLSANAAARPQYRDGDSPSHNPYSSRAHPSSASSSPSYQRQSHTGTPPTIRYAQPISFLSRCSQESTSSPTAPRPAVRGGTFRNVRVGLWNRRGDHITQEGFLVKVPPKRAYPSDLADYPEDDFLDHQGTNWKERVADRPQHPDTVPQLNGKPKKTYDEFIKYTLIEGGKH